MNKKLKKLLLFSAICLSSISFASIPDVTFPYGKFKEIDFKNDALNAIFENYITQIQKKDTSYNLIIEEYNNAYIEKLVNQQRRKKYKNEDDYNKLIYNLNKAEKENINNIYNLFYTNELKIFNELINNVKNSLGLTDREKKVMLTAIEPMHKTYSNFSVNFKGMYSYVNNTCFSLDDKDLDKTYVNFELTNEYCSNIYNRFNKDFSLNFKSFSVFSMNSLVSKYLSNIAENNYSEKMKIKVDRLNRIQSFKN